MDHFTSQINMFDSLAQEKIYSTLCLRTDRTTLFHLCDFCVTSLNNLKYSVLI